MRALVKLGAGAVAVIALGVLAFLFLRGGDKGRIEDLIRQAVADGAAGDAEKCIATIDPAYSFDGLDHAEVCGLVRRYVKPGAWKKAEVRSMDVGVDGETASATVRLWLEGSAVREALGGVPLTLELNLRRIDGAWKISGHRVKER
jgi:hypothetical protein